MINKRMSRIDLWTRALYKWHLKWDFSLLCGFDLRSLWYSESALKNILLKCLNACYFFSLRMIWMKWMKKNQGKQSCCRWVNILSSCSHVIWQELNCPSLTLPVASFPPDLTQAVADVLWGQPRELRSPSEGGMLWSLLDKQVTLMFWVMSVFLG